MDKNQSTLPSSLLYNQKQSKNRFTIDQANYGSLKLFIMHTSRQMPLHHYFKRQGVIKLIGDLNRHSNIQVNCEIDQQNDEVVVVGFNYICCEEQNNGTLNIQDVGQHFRRIVDVVQTQLVQTMTEYGIRLSLVKLSADFIKRVMQRLAKFQSISQQQLIQNQVQELQILNKFNNIQLNDNCESNRQ